MWIYYILFLFIVIIASKDFIKIDPVINKAINVLLLLVLICFFGFRYNCDNDYNNYADIYSATPSLAKGAAAVVAYSVLVSVELGYTFVSAFFKMLSLSTQSIFIFSALLTFSIIYSVFKRNSLFPIISLLIYFAQFFSLPFIQMRFGIAMSLVLLASFYLFRGKKLKYWLLIILGASFQFCALGGIAVFLFYKIDWLKRPVLLWSTLLLSLFLMLLPLRGILIAIMSSVGIERYVRLYADAESASPISNVISAILLVPLIYYRNFFSKVLPETKILLSMGLSSIFVGSLVWQLGILNRFSMITATTFCLIIPSYLMLLQTRKERFVGYLLIILYSFLKFLPNMNFVTEYQTFFNQSF